MLRRKRDDKDNGSGISYNSRTILVDRMNDESYPDSQGRAHRAKLVRFKIQRLRKVSIFHSMWQHEVRISAVRGLISSGR